MADTSRRADSRPSQLRPEQEPAPYDLHLEAAAAAVAYSRAIKQGGCLRFPWTDIDAMVGPLRPGWLVLWGGRKKAGKSTVLREVFNDWVNLGHRIVYVGTEQETEILKLLWACLRLGFPPGVAFDVTDPRHELVLHDVTVTQGPLSERGIMVADPGLTLDNFVHWVRYAFKLKARAIILDHFHRLDCMAGDEQYRAIREIKRVAAKSNLVILAGAQLTNGEGGPLLGEYEVPGGSSWAGSENLGRECDVALQGWRPFIPGIKRGEKQLARENPEKLAAIIQNNTMGVRLAAHRYRDEGDGAPTAARLYVHHGALRDWSGR